MENQNNMYKGFELFSDIADGVLRTRNRAVVLANMAQDHSKNSLISAKGVALILGYFSKIPMEEREEVKVQFATAMQERGFRLTA